MTEDTIPTVITLEMLEGIPLIRASILEELWIDENLDDITGSASYGDIALFKEHFPEGMPLTREALAKAAELGFDLTWMIYNLFNLEANAQIISESALSQARAITLRRRVRLASAVRVNKSLEGRRLFLFEIRSDREKGILALNKMPLWKRILGLKKRQQKKLWEELENRNDANWEKTKDAVRSIRTEFDQSERQLDFEFQQELAQAIANTLNLP